MGKGDVKILILGDAKDAQRAFNDAARYSSDFHGKARDGFAESGRHADGFGKKLGGVRTAMLGLGAVGFGALVFGAKDAIQSAMHLEETMSKSGVVFGEAADEIKAWGETAVETMLLSKQEAIGSAATYGSLFQGMGMTKEASVGMAKSLVGLAADLRSFNDVPIEEVFAALQSGLTGEIEPMRRFSSNLSAVRIDAEALRLGLVKGNVSLADVETATVAITKANMAAAKALKEHGAGSIEYRDAAAKVAQAEENLSAKIAGKVPELDAAQKAQAAYSLIMQDTVLAQGDVGRTMDSASNKTVASQKRFEELKTEIGTKLLPIYVGAMDAMNKAAGEVKKWWDENGENLKKKFTDIFGTDPVDNFKRGLKEVGVIFDDLKGRVSLAHAQFELGAVGIYKSIGPAWEGLGKLLLWLKNSVLDPLWGSVQNGIAGTVSAFGTLKSVIDPIVGTIQDMNRKLDELSRNPLIGAFVSGIRSLNPLMNMGDNTPFQGGKATGGILPDGMSWVGEHGRELAVTQGGQSRIIPNQNTGAALGGSRTVIVETPTLLYLDGNVVARSQRRRELQIR